jgi:hypothetical protein
MPVSRKLGPWSIPCWSSENSHVTSRVLWCPAGGWAVGPCLCQGGWASVHALVVDKYQLHTHAGGWAPGLCLCRGCWAPVHASFTSRAINSTALHSKRTIRASAADIATYSSTSGCTSKGSQGLACQGRAVAALPSSADVGPLVHAGCEDVGPRVHASPVDRSCAATITF